jgi:hypothetical protein
LKQLQVPPLRAPEQRTPIGMAFACDPRSLALRYSSN